MKSEKHTKNEANALKVLSSDKPQPITNLLAFKHLIKNNLTHASSGKLDNSENAINTLKSRLQVLFPNAEWDRIEKNFNNKFTKIIEVINILPNQNDEAYLLKHILDGICADGTNKFSDTVISRGEELLSKDKAVLQEDIKVLAGYYEKELPEDLPLKLDTLIHKYKDICYNQRGTPLAPGGTIIVYRKFIPKPKPKQPEKAVQPVPQANDPKVPAVPTTNIPSKQPGYEGKIGEFLDIQNEEIDKKRKVPSITFRKLFQSAPKSHPKIQIFTSKKSPPQVPKVSPEGGDKKRQKTGLNPTEPARVQPILPPISTLTQMTPEQKREQHPFWQNTLDSTGRMPGKLVLPPLNNTIEEILERGKSDPSFPRSFNSGRFPNS